MPFTAQDAKSKQVARKVSLDDEVQKIIQEIQANVGVDARKDFYVCRQFGDEKVVSMLEELGYEVKYFDEECRISWKNAGLTSNDYLILEQQKTFEKLHKKNNVIIILCIIIILLLLLRWGFLLFQNKQTGLVALVDTPPVSIEIPDWDPDVVVPPEDSGIQWLNEQLELDEMCVNMRGEVTFDDTYSAGYVNIVNDKANSYPQFVTITMSNGIEIYKSGLIPPGKGIMFATLDVEVPQGIHKCKVLFSQVDIEQNKICGQAAANIIITIKE